MSPRIFRYIATALCALLLGVASLGAQATPTQQANFLQHAAQEKGVLYTFALPKGRSAVVYKSGIAKVYTADFKGVMTRMVPGLTGPAPLSRPSKAEIRFELSKKPRLHPYAEGEVIVVYRSGVTASKDRITVPLARLRAMRAEQAKGALAAHAKSVPQYTTSAKLNLVLAKLGVDKSTRLFAGLAKSQLHGMVARARSRTGHAWLNIANAYQLHITHSSVHDAVEKLEHSGAVAYVSPAFYVTTMHTRSVPLSRLGGNAVYRQAQGAVRSPQMLSGRESVKAAAATSYLPSNYGLQSSLQSMFNAPGLNAAAAYSEIAKKFGQLPGQGEIITNVSLGDLDDISAKNDPKDPCYGYVSAYGPTTIMQGGQRYLDMPSMPLIPTYTADTNGNLDGAGEVCGIDPQLVEIGLDFSVMAPLPHDKQRPGAIGSGVTDLLGIAPGADYRLVVPAGNAPTMADIDAALLAAALQEPRPSIITASIGFGEDQFGFPGRYLEDDPLSAAVIGAIVNNYHIVMTISSNDGLRTYTNASVSPSGGSAPTNISHGDPTKLNDIYLSTAPSRDPDSGAICVGGTTLDDIFAAPPQDSANAALKAQHAFAETRWTGSQNFSSGFGERVNVSAPSDNIVAFVHKLGGTANDVGVLLNGGTSASAPEVAAAAAVLMQVARLTDQPFQGPKAVRTFLEQTGTPVPKVPQSDVDNHVGPQVNLGHAVEALLAKADQDVSPQVARVAVEQRRGGPTFQSDTNPASINIDGDNTRSWITIAPDWQGLPDGTTYQLTVAPASASSVGVVANATASANAAGGTLATTSWARVLPKEIFAAAGMPLVSSESRTLLFTYAAILPGSGAQTVTARFKLTFGPVAADYTITRMRTPAVQPVVHGVSFPVHYDLSHSGVGRAKVVVSYPGRVVAYPGGAYRPAYSVWVSGKGTVDVPVSALQGGGIYAIRLLQFPPSNTTLSRYAYTRVQPTVSTVRPPAPLLSANGFGPTHLLVIPYGSDVAVSWDASGVPGASGAMLEISASGPNLGHSYAMFNNPNGSERDANGIDTGSQYYVRLPGVSGTTTLSGTILTKVLAATLVENIRVLPMAGGTVVGEAGEVSTITMNGVVPTGGGSPTMGWGVDQHGTSGMLTSLATAANGQQITSVQTFDQKTNAITHVVASKPSGLGNLIGQLFLTPARATSVYKNNLALLSTERIDYKNFDIDFSFHTLSPISGGNIGPTWTPPTQYITAAAPNQDNEVALFAGLESRSNPDHVLFTSDIAKNTFSPLYDVDQVLSQFYANTYCYVILQDTQTHTGILGCGDAGDYNQPPVFVTIDLDDGDVTGTFQGLAAGGMPISGAIDPRTGKALMTMSSRSTMFIYDSTTGSVLPVRLPGGTTVTSTEGAYSAVDEQRGLFLVFQKLPVDWATNNNALGAVLVYDEQGNLLKTIERFNLWYIYTHVPAHNLQVIPSRGVGYAMGLGLQQLAPFQYADSAPLANDGTLVTVENKSAQGVVEATAPIGVTLTYSIVDQPEHGSVTLDDANKGTYTYTSDAGYAGDDSFTFKANDGQEDSNVATVYITVNAVNKPPVANDGSLTVQESQSASGTLQANDPDGDSLVFSIVAQPQHGSVTLTDATTGAYVYTPASGYSGSDSFTFKASDGQADSNTATVSVTVEAVMPPPPPKKDSGGGAFDWFALLVLLGLSAGAYATKRRADEK